MTILVTGAGLIATHTARSLLDQGVGVVIYDPNPSLSYIESVVGPDRKLFHVEQGDVRDLPHIIDLMLRRGVTRILHTGGLVAPKTEENASLAFDVNVVGTRNMIEAARIRSLNRIVFVSSATVYGRSERTGSGPKEDEPYRPPSSFYAAYKAACEIIGLAYHQIAGVNLIICRPCAVYGRRDAVDGGPASRAIQNALMQAMSSPAGTTIPLDVPTGERAYVKDVALAVREAIFVEKPSTRVYNVGSGEIASAATFAAAINQAVPGANVIPASTGAEAPAPLPLDLTLARAELKYEPQWPVQRAITDFADELRAAAP
ncbi:MAG: nucleoside-diphosphate-sugar epimerase [Chloroflexi bacterium]|nr:nucleoside-diphosphate-sugar epimerase [Chloroflexota bacterium]